MPLVATSIGAEGIDVVPERDLLIADTPEQFAAQISRVFTESGLRAETRDERPPPGRNRLFVGFHRAKAGDTVRSATEMNAASAPRMSIVVGTLNRGEVLGRSLDSLLAQDFPKDRYEIIVVDNGCTDGTEALVRARMATADNLRYVKEPKLGLSNARNKGIAESRFELVGFFDDDATAQARLAHAAHHYFCQRSRSPVPPAGPSSSAGPPRARTGCRRPAKATSATAITVRSASSSSFPSIPYGSNMVIRKEHLLAINGFSDKVGPKGGNMMSAGEQDLFSRLYKIPIRVMYEPAAPGRTLGAGRTRQPLMGAQALVQTRPVEHADDQQRRSLTTQAC